MNFRHLWRLFCQTFSLSFSVMLMYRQNLIYFLLFESIFVFSHFLSFDIGLNLAGGAIAGWNRPQLFLLLAINTFSHLLFISFFIGPIFNLSDHIWNGTLDYALMKPLPGPIAIYFTNQFIISNLPNLVIAFGLMLYFLAENAINWSIGKALLLIAATFLGLAVRVALAVFMMVPAFFSERLTDGEGSFWSIAGLGRYPTSMFPRVLEYVVTYLIPVGMMAAIPAQTVTGQEHAGALFGALVAGVVFTWLAYAFLQFGLRNYKSVNAGL